MSETVEATGYLTIEGTRSRYPSKSVVSAKIIRLTQGKPAVLEGDQVAVKVTVEIPAAAFDPLEPIAIVIVPEELIQHPVTVEAVSE